MKKKLVKAIYPLIAMVIFIVFTILIKYVDVQSIGIHGTNVGLATFNQYFLNLISRPSSFMDILSDIIMVISLLIILLAVILGLYQLIKRKSLKKVDSAIIAVGISTVLLVILYFVFDKLILINYIPIDMTDIGFFKPSYPSTHVMTVTFVLLFVLLFLPTWSLKKGWKMAISAMCIMMIILVCICRLMAKAHWMSDIIGGVLLGGFLALLAWFLAPIISKKEINN